MEIDFLFNLQEQENIKIRKAIRDFDSGTEFYRRIKKKELINKKIE